MLLLKVVVADIGILKKEEEKKRCRVQSIDCIVHSAPIKMLEHHVNQMQNYVLSFKGTVA